MKTLDISKANASLGDYARGLKNEPLLLTDGNEPVAALMPIDEGDVEALSLGANEKLMALLEQARAQRRAGQGFTSDEVRRQLGLS